MKSMVMMMLLTMTNFSESVIVLNHSFNHYCIKIIIHIEKSVDSKFLLDSMGWLEHIFLCGNQLGKFLLKRTVFWGNS